MKDKNIILIGMPGAGKSTIGVLLAKTINKPFIDTDLLIQQKEKDFLQNIIRKNGIEGFLSIEESVILETDLKNHVIATGGSVIYSEKSMKHLKRNGILIYLDLPLEAIENRIKNIKTRGIAMGQNQSLQSLYTARKPLYEKYSDFTIDCDNKDMEDVILKITSLLYKK
ncbi:shikimate kinase [Pseudobacteroides cellulosolvens]|uniref:Shikimate kinase n=1 Tax=Pseudobacteroides cellulosolvens ATCC 35603 = DSM 2933 TaxID=398512 RepID=A0A0L6JT59_9FIRM|nr:shikimate kinase [Pseudobacteroides cellulosolvens]KNY28607.1 Shikimate kinase [Pseudobacteroides cellulosolvens ATCC 35603 = DSM 2933]